MTRRKRKLKAFPATKAVKLAARELLGTPPPARVVPDQKKKAKAQRKHKLTLEKLMRDEL